MDNMHVCLAGVRDGRCRAVTRKMTLDQETRAEWEARKLEVVVLSWEEAIKMADKGFRRSIKMLRDDIIKKGRR